MSKDKANTIEDCINGLCDDLAPVKRLRHPLLRIAPWIVVSMLYVSVLVFHEGLRADIGHKLYDPAFLFEITLMAFIGISAACASSFMCVPDMRGHKWLIIMPFNGLALFAIWSLIRVRTEGLHMPQLHMDHCMGEGVFMAIVPVTILMFMMRKGSPIRPYMCAFMNIIAAMALGYTGLRFTCMMDTVGHATVSHLIPYVLLGALLGLGARKIYKW